MKPRETLALAARLVVGGVLVYAAIAKISAPAEEFAYIIQAYDVVPPSMALPMAGLLPWLELLVGWSLILGVNARGACAAAGAMFAMFLAALGSTIFKGIPLPNCGCFGDAIHFSPSQAFLFDSAMIALCALAFRDGPRPLSLDRWSERGL